MTYQQAYSKIIDAYFKDEIKPFDSKFCFCGTLNNGEELWGDGFPENKFYSGLEYDKMEKALFDGMNEIYFDATNGGWNEIEHKTIGEDALFNGMCKALDVLKEIHRSRGENVDEDIPAFTKRELAKVL